MTVIIPNLAIAGYRSFGKTLQYFEQFAKINLFIGRNNAGKSNVIRFLKEIFPNINQHKTLNLDDLVAHLPSKPTLTYGYAHDFDGTFLNEEHPFVQMLVESRRNSRDDISFRVRQALTKVMNEKRRLDGTGLCWSFITYPDQYDQSESWLKAVQTLDKDEMYPLWHWATNQQNGSRQHHWEPELVNWLSRYHPKIVANVVVIPAIRQIGAKGSTSDGFDGNGIIERLARLQNPNVHNQSDKQRFFDINNFLRSVIDSPEATIEVPHGRDTILIHMDGKVLPIESLGSGIHEVIILAAAATVLSKHVVCIEEPELHLNPVLQRKLMRYLSDHTDNQYFISTHSAALMDNPGVEIYHVKLDNFASVVERVTSDGHKSLVCEDLGYHPSDLLQTNCVIWVEGPSDRIYINHWLKKIAPEFIEGIHYSIMFYGGRLASHLSNEDYSNEKDIDDFISLRRLNRRGVIVLDSDRAKKRAQINSTKQRLRSEFDKGPGYAWITEGREVENYIPKEQLRAAIAAVCPRAKLLTNLEKYDNCLKIISQKGKESQAPKVDVARYVVGNFDLDLNVFDLKQQMKKIVDFVRKSNPQAQNLPHIDND